MRRFAAYRVGEVELTDERWRHILVYHPDVRGFQKQIAATLATPDTIHRSRYDPKVLIFYFRAVRSKYLAVVIKTNRRNFILTAYFTERIQHRPL
ncbi:MAG: hypothetical protein Q8R35_00380 [bacterium]|nr:hypothetical protein [bacterium]